jgi:phosphoribosylanthranilate isomerase
MLASAISGLVMFRVKICGITNLSDAQLAAEAGADAVGLNFCTASPRYCPWEAAREIAAALPRGVCKVGVFVDASAEEIRRAAESVPLDLVQLHGHEPPELVRALRPLPILRAVSIDEGLTETSAYLEACYRQLALPRMLLVDARSGGRFGGTGTTVDWKLLVESRPSLRGLPLVLAGGLTPQNVAEAIALVRPWAVDVASGVEASPGAKSPELVRRFVAAARQAFEQVSARN